MSCPGVGLRALTTSRGSYDVGGIMGYLGKCSVATPSFNPVDNTLVTKTGSGLFGGGLDFLQLRANYRVRGRAGDRSIDFTAAGTAETFRGR